MDSIISIVGIVIGILMNAPSYENALSERQKRRLGNHLFHITNLIEIIIQTGYEFLSQLEDLPDGPSSRTEKVSYYQISRLKRTVTEQLKNIEDLINMLNIMPHVKRKNMAGVFADQFSNEEDHNKAVRLLAFYDPELRRAFETDLKLKRGFLSNMIIDHTPSYISIDYESNTNYGRIIIKDPIEGVEIDLLNIAEKKKYLAEARQRLKTLESNRIQLVSLLSKHFEPHHFI